MRVSLLTRLSTPPNVAKQELSNVKSIQTLQPAKEEYRNTFCIIMEISQ